MGILTNFLKLLKPEPNDFVDVTKHISENYDKLDQNAKTTNQALTNLNNSKLDKGTYPGKADDLNTEISKIASTTQLGRIIVGKGMTADSAGRVSIISKNDGIVVNDNDIELNIVDNLTTNSPTRSLSAKQGKKLFDEKQNITDIVNNLTTTVPGKVLDGRQGPAIVNKINGLAGGYSGTFPLTTAVKEGIYLLPATNKFYVCVKNYNGTNLTAPNANFEELSVFQNRNKLENLCIFDTGSTSTAAWVKLPNGLLIQWSTASVWGTFTYPKPFKDMNYILLAAYSSGNVDWTPNISSPTMFKVSATQGNIYSKERVQGYWLALGY